MGRSLTEEESEKPLSEPELVNCPFLSGASLAVEGEILRFEGWVEIDGERRVRVRFAMPMQIARALNAQFRRMLGIANH